MNTNQLLDWHCGSNRCWEVILHSGTISYYWSFKRVHCDWWCGHC